MFQIDFFIQFTNTCKQFAIEIAGIALKSTFLKFLPSSTGKRSPKYKIVWVWLILVHAKQNFKKEFEPLQTRIIFQFFDKNTVYIEEFIDVFFFFILVDYDENNNIPLVSSTNEYLVSGGDIFFFNQ